MDQAQQGMDPEFIKTIFNQYFCQGPEILARLDHAGPVHDAEISVHQDSSDVDVKHFASQIKRVSLHVKSPQTGNVKAPMIIKTRKDPTNLIQAINHKILFRTEIEMYRNVLPLMRHVMTRVGDEREALWPVMYGYQSSRLIAFQDLMSVGFEVKSIKTGLNAEDSLMVIRNIARFHSMSKSLIDSNLVSLPSWEDIEIVVIRTYSTLLAVLCDSMQTDWAKEWIPMMKWIRAHHNDILHTFSRIHSEYDKRFDVVNHGDLWTSNIMFRKTDGSENSPMSVRFVDFQVCAVNSFIWDLEFFFWTSINPKIRTTLKSSLLREYQKSLEANLKIFGYSGYIPTLDDVLAESKRIEIAGLGYLLLGAVMRSDIPQALNMDKLMTHSPLEVVKKAVFADQKAQKIIGEDLKYLSQLGIIRST